MRPLFPLRRALTDPALLGGEHGISGESWRQWRVILLAAVGETLTDDELAAFRELTRRAPPGQMVKQLYAIAGRRAGKSKGLAGLVTYLSCCCAWPRVSEKLRAVIIAPDSRQAEDFLVYCSEFINNSPLLRGLIRKQNTEEIELADPEHPGRRGVTIVARAASFRRLRGMTCICCVADECAFFHSDDGSAMPDVEIITAMKPTLLTTGGPLLVASSPLGQRGELFRVYKAHFGQDDPAILVAHCTTLEFHPTADREAIEAEIRSDPVRFEAEYMARFRATADNLLSREAIERCTDIDVRERMPERGVEYTCFVDVSGGVSDAMVLAVAHASGKGAVLDCLDIATPQPGKPLVPAAVVERFARTMARYQTFTVFGDDYGRQWVVEAFAAHGISYEPPRHQDSDSRLTTSEIYLEATPLINSGLVRLLDHGELADQLTALERHVTASGRERISHPVRDHDDIACAACGSLVMAMQRGELRPAHRLQAYALQDSSYEWGRDGYSVGPDPLHRDLDLPARAIY